METPVQVSDDGSTLVVLADSEQRDLHHNADGTGVQRSIPGSIIKERQFATLPPHSTAFSTTMAAFGTGWLLKVRIKACPQHAGCLKRETFVAVVVCASSNRFRASHVGVMAPNLPTRLYPRRGADPSSPLVLYAVATITRHHPSRVRTRVSRPVAGDDTTENPSS